MTSEFSNIVYRLGVSHTIIRYFIDSTARRIRVCICVSVCIVLYSIRCEWNSTSIQNKLMNVKQIQWNFICKVLSNRPIFISLHCRFGPEFYINILGQLYMYNPCRNWPSAQHSANAELVRPILGNCGWAKYKNVMRGWCWIPNHGPPLESKSQLMADWPWPS